MLILAKSIKGQEFLYNPNSAHKVSKRSGELIRDRLNNTHYDLKENETWYLHNVDMYDNAYYVAETQSFTIYGDSLREKRNTRRY